MANMVRRSYLPLWLLGTVLAIQAGNSACAQDTERYERYFRDLDRNNNGEVEPDEFLRIRDSTRERLLQMGIAGNRPVKQQEFLAGMAGADEIRRKQEEAEREERNQSSGNSSSSSSSSRGSYDPRSRGRSKPRITYTLPSAYLQHDKNGDGQISLAEWDRAKLADFRKLDRNGDGFLAPKELVNPGPDAAAVTVAAVAAPPRTTPTSTSSASGSTAAKPAASSASSTPAPAEDPLLKQAKFYFTTVDKDKDGQISTEEWASSRGARPLFEKAGVMPSLPMTESAFSEQFVKIKQTQQ
jgi:Ca2+-binding EF-hand superfamily protein